ncbi:MAG: rane protein [Caulobacteraceae bacterium]|nr:rane protein [Caulobacteraceae bacterium]
MTAAASGIDEQIDLWRAHLRRRQAIHAADIAELEDHLRELIATLTSAGLAPDEAFLVAVKRMGAQDAIAGEFAREHSERLWKQLVVPTAVGGAAGGVARRDALFAVGLAIAAAVLAKIPALFGLGMDSDAGFYARNLPFFALPLLTLYLARKRGLDGKALGLLAAGFVIAVLIADLYPFGGGPRPGRVMPGLYSDTSLLMAIHMPVLLWAMVGVAYAGGRWRDGAARMNFIRFSGELAIYFALMGLGGGVLIAFTVAMFTAIGINPETLVAEWLLPCGMVGAVIVAAWLVEAKQSLIETMAPVLTRLFAPLFTLLLLGFLGAMAVSGRGIHIERNVLIAFDLLLLLILGLLLYSISARDPEAAPNGFDLLILALLASALLADGVALTAMAARIGELGSSPNRAAGLGMNLVLLINLGWAAWLQLRFAMRRGSFAAVERWQTGYLPVLVLWAGVVAIVFPPVFGFR